MLRGAAKGVQNPGEEALSIMELSKKYHNMYTVLNDLGIPFRDNNNLSLAFLCAEAGVDYNEVFIRLNNKELQLKRAFEKIQKLTIHPGLNKDSKQEIAYPLEFQIGEVIAIIGSTGSGKSQLLNDIEGLARGDSLSKRNILVDDHPFSEELYLNQTLKPVAHISQSMNYMIDLPVGDFLDIHCSSQNLEVSHKLKKKVITTACTICEESFSLNTNIINLSGGQSRALMIADALYISNSPVILVDEIENAGIDKQNALKLLIREGNITFMATHDPLIALMAHKRIVMKNGGITKIIQRTPQEENTLEKLSFENNKINQLKARLRNGEELGEY